MSFPILLCRADSEVWSGAVYVQLKIHNRYCWLASLTRYAALIVCNDRTKPAGLNVGQTSADRSIERLRQSYAA